MAGKARNGQPDDDMDAAANGRAEDMNDPALLHYVQALERRQDRHESGCQDERQAADRRREELHKKVDDGFARTDKKIDDLATKIDGSLSKIHERLNTETAEGHKREVKAWDWRLKAAVWVIGGLLGVAGYAVVQWFLARGVAG